MIFNKKKVQENAARLMKEEAFIKALNDVEENYVNMWKQTDPRDEDARERLYLAVQLIKKIGLQIASYYQDEIFDKKVAEEEFKVKKSNVLRGKLW